MLGNAPSGGLGYSTFSMHHAPWADLNVRKGRNIIPKNKKSEMCRSWVEAWLVMR